MPIKMKKGKNSVDSTKTKLAPRSNFKPSPLQLRAILDEVKTFLNHNGFSKAASSLKGFEEWKRNSSLEQTATSSGSSSESSGGSSSSPSVSSSSDPSSESETEMSRHDKKVTTEKAAILKHAPNTSSTSSDASSNSSALESESESESESDSDNEESVPPVLTGVKKAMITPASTSSSSSDSSSESDSDSEPAKKHTPKPDKSIQSSHSSSDNSSSSASDSDDSSGSEPEKKGSISSSSASSSSESCDDSDSSCHDSSVRSVLKSKSETLKKKGNLPSPESISTSSKSTSRSLSDLDHKEGTESNAKESAASSTDSSATLALDSPVPSIGLKRKFAGSPKMDAPVKAQKNHINNRFQRIKTDIEVDPKLSSNAYVSYDYADRAHADLITTKGKGFTKEKNKKKRGSYRGGMIDISGGKGIKFDD